MQKIAMDGYMSIRMKLAADSLKEEERGEKSLQEDTRTKKTLFININQAFAGLYKNNNSK